MDVESIQTNVAAKIPMLKQNEFEMWRLRIEQYFQVQDYALWEIIEDGDSYQPTTTTSTVDGKVVTTLQTHPTSAEDRIKKKNDLKARSMLMMTIPNDQLLNFRSSKMPSHYLKLLLRDMVEMKPPRKPTRHCSSSSLKTSPLHTMNLLTTCLIGFRIL